MPSKLMDFFEISDLNSNSLNLNLNLNLKELLLLKEGKKNLTHFKEGRLRTKTCATLSHQSLHFPSSLKAPFKLPQMMMMIMIKKRTVS